MDKATRYANLSAEQAQELVRLEKSFGERYEKPIILVAYEGK